MKEREILTLLGLPGIGRRRAARLLGHVSEGCKPMELLSLLELENFKGVSIPAIEAVRSSEADAERALEYCRTEGINVVSMLSPGMPSRLINLSDPPLILFVRGNLSLLSQDKSLAVVGSRTPTAYGGKSAERIAGHAAKRGFAVVSGLALGIDTWAHTGCINAGGGTVAVLPSSFANIYPRENIGLAEKILASGGCLVSEYPPFQPPDTYQFIERDRLQSGLSQGVIVVESEIDGGAMHTAEFCRQQKRLLGCVVPPDGALQADPHFSGNAKILSQGGAAAIEGQLELLEFLSKLA